MFRQRDELIASTEEECISVDKKRPDPLLHQASEERVDVACGSRVHHNGFLSEGASRRLQVSRQGLNIGIGRVDERGNYGGRRD